MLLHCTFLYRFRPAVLAWAIIELQLIEGLEKLLKERGQALGCQLRWEYYVKFKICTMIERENMLLVYLFVFDSD